MRGFAALFIWWKSDGILEYKQKTKTHCWLNSVYGCSLSICVRKAHSAQPLMGSATPERFQLRTSVRPSSANSGIATNCRRQALPMSVCTIRSRLSQLTVINHPFMLLGLRSGQLFACMMSLAQPLPLYSRFHCARCAYVRHVRVGTAPAFALPSCNCFSVVLCTQRFWGVLLLIVTFCMQVEYLLLPSNWIIVLLAQLHFVCSFFRLLDVNIHYYDSVIVEWFQLGFVDGRIIFLIGIVAAVFALRATAQWLINLKWNAWVCASIG